MQQESSQAAQEDLQGLGKEASGQFGAAIDAVEGLPVPLEHILREVFELYEARSPEQLVKLLRRRYSKDAVFIDPTMVAKPRREVALAFFALQHLFAAVRVSGIGQPEVYLASQPRGSSLLQVIVHNRQRCEFARSMHISQEILPEQTTLDTTTCLLLDPRTGLVLRHEDCWHNKPAFRLPMAWRRLNCVCTNAVYRLCGWGRVLDEAEARARSSWEG